MKLNKWNRFYPNKRLKKTFKRLMNGSLGEFLCRDVQSFSEVTDQLGMVVLSVIPGNPFLWTFLMENFHLDN